MNKYIRAVSSNYIFFSINTIFFLIITAVAIRIMGEELYGLWAILNAVLLFSGIGMLGMGVVVNKFASEGGENALPANSIISAAVLILLPMAIIVMSLIIIARNWVAAQFGLTPQQQIQFSLALTLTALSIVPQFLGRIPHGYLLSQLKNDLARTVESVTAILIWTGAVIIASTNNNNLVWMSLWVLCIQITSASILFAIVIPMTHFQWQIEKKTILRMERFSGFSFLESLASGLFNQFDRILVGFIIGPAAAGVYAVGTSMALRLTLITNQIAEVIVPYASYKSSTNQQDKLYSIFRKSSQLAGLIVGTLTTVVILWMNNILSLWLSPAYAEKYVNIFRALLLAYLLISMSRLGHQVLTGTGKVKLVALIYLATSSFMLTMVYIFSLHYGITGAALANLAMSFLLLFNLLVYREHEKDFFLAFINDLRYTFVIPCIVYVYTVLHQEISLQTQIIGTLLLGLISIYHAYKIGAWGFVQEKLKIYRIK